MGRVKLPIKKIENTTSRQVTFSKRRNGLVKKAYELSVLCDVDVALIMFSPSGRPGFFSGNKSIEEILERYFNLTEGAHERMRDQQHIRKLLSKLKEETDQICQAPSQMTDSQIQDLRREILICKSRLKEMEKRLRMFEGDPSEITTVSEAENREYVLQETLKQVQLRKCVLEEYNFHASQSPQVDAVKSVDVVTGASKKAVDWFPHVETLEFSNVNDDDAPVTWTLVHSENMSTLEAGNGINNTLLPQFEQAIHTNSSSTATWDHLYPSGSKTSSIAETREAQVLNSVFFLN